MSCFCEGIRGSVGNCYITNTFQGFPVGTIQSFEDLVQEFQPAFTEPTFRRFRRLLLAWIATTGRRTITRLIQCPVGRGGDGPVHHAGFHRFFTRAVWDPDRLGGILLRLVLPVLGSAVTLIVDDTLCRSVIGMRRFAFC